MKFTKNTNAFRGTFNEIKIIDYLIKFSNCRPINEIVPKNYAEILASMSPVEMECETERAYHMAQMIHKYCREELNWFKIDNILWTAEPKVFKDQLLDNYCSHSHPADLVLIAPNSYLGVSLKNYTKIKLIGHKATAFSNFVDFPVTSREMAIETALEILNNNDHIEIAHKLFHVHENPYIEVIGAGDYQRTEYFMKKCISTIDKISFTPVPKSNKIQFELTDRKTVHKGNIIFKKTHTTKDGIEKFNMLTFVEI